MKSFTKIDGQRNIVIQDVSDSTITINLDGELQEIKKELESFKAFFISREANFFKWSQGTYNIREITELDFPYIFGKKKLNDFFTKEMIQRLSSFSEPAIKFLKVVEEISDWEIQCQTSDKAKNIIASSFIGFIGIQIRKLIAIGKEEFSAKTQKKYIETSITIAKRSLQLLTFVLVSDLWNQRRFLSANLTLDQRKLLTSFFEDGIEMSLGNYSNLFLNTCLIYQNNKLPFPLPELNELLLSLKMNNDFFDSCSRLHSLQKAVDADTFSVIDCISAEKFVTLMLGHLSFLSNYKMVSIKNIQYEGMRNNPSGFLHYYTALHLESKFTSDAVLVNFDTKPVSTDAVLLYKGRYQENINLFPFIIDINSLEMIEGTRIFYFSCIDFMDGSISYQSLEDQHVENISFKDTVGSITHFSHMILDKEKWKNLKRNAVFQQLHHAKQALLS